MPDYMRDVHRRKRDNINRIAIGRKSDRAQFHMREHSRERICDIFRRASSVLVSAIYTSIYPSQSLKALRARVREWSRSSIRTLKNAQ